MSQNDNDMSNEELDILDYLEECYTGARTANDMSAMIRIARAMAAFKADPADAPASVFSESFLDSYYFS